MVQPLKTREGGEETPRAAGGHHPPPSPPELCGPRTSATLWTNAPRGVELPRTSATLWTNAPRGRSCPRTSATLWTNAPRGRSCPRAAASLASTPEMTRGSVPWGRRVRGWGDPCLLQTLRTLRGRHPTGDPRILSSYVLSLKSVKQNKIVINN